MKHFSMFFLATALLSIGCGSNSDSSDDSSNDIVLGSTALTPLPGGSVMVQDGQTQGDGSLVGKNPLGSVESGTNFRVKATLQEAGEFILMAYGTRENQNGITLSFVNSSGTLSVTAKVGSEIADLSTQFAGQSASSLDFSIDVHNDEAPAHVIVWAGDATGDPLFNSEDHVAIPGQGSGTFYGVTLKSAALSQLDVAEPKFEGEEE